MAGYGKWANIKYRKGMQDARCAEIFTKPNPRQRATMDKALDANMTRPNDLLKQTG